MAPVELQMDVHCNFCVKKIKKAVENQRGVRSVWASPEQGLVVVHGTADAYALQRRIERKMERPVEIVSDGSAPYYYPAKTAAPRYGSSSRPHAYYSDPLPSHAYYSQPPPHAYYSHPPPPPPPPPAGSYPYAAGGYDAGWAHPDPYGYEEDSTVPLCSIQ